MAADWPASTAHKMIYLLTSYTVPLPITSASYGKKVQEGLCPVQDSVREHFALTMVTGPIPSCHGRDFAQCF